MTVEVLIGVDDWDELARSDLLDPPIGPAPSRSGEAPGRARPGTTGSRGRSRAGHRLKVWATTHARSIVTLVVVLAVVAPVYLAGLQNYPGRVDDEGSYVAQAWAVQHWHVLAHYTYWYDHPPLGWMLIALWTWATNAWNNVGYSVTAGRQVMVVAHLVSCVLMYSLARRLGIRRSLAAAAVLIFSFSPLALYYQRMVYLDNLATPFLLGAFVLAMSPNRRLVAHAASGACFAAAVLTKETTLLLLPALGYQLWQRTERHKRDFSVAMFASLLLVVGAIYPLYALLKQEFLPGPGHVSLVDGIRFQLFRRGTGGVLSPNSVAHRQVAQWLHLDPWLLLAGALATLLVVWIPKYRPLAAACLTLMILLLRTGYMPVPYVIGLLTFAPLMIVAGANHAWNWCASPPGAHMRRPGIVSTSRTMSAFATCAVVVAAALFGPGWFRSDARATEVSADTPTSAAERWILASLPRGKPVLVGDTLWLDMVRAGWSSKNVVWFYKLDTDSSVKHQFPAGWQDFQYVISTDEMRASAVGQLPQVEAALAHSSVIRAFGAGGNVVEVREIDRAQSVAP